MTYQQVKKIFINFDLTGEFYKDGPITPAMVANALESLDIAENPEKL